MKEGDKIFLCGTVMEFKYYSGNKSAFAWYHEGKEFLYMKETHEVEKLIEAKPEILLDSKNVPREPFHDKTLSTGVNRL